MKTLRAASLIMSYLYMSQSLVYADEERQLTVTWAINDAPPFHVIEGEYQNSGICDVLIDSLKDTMTHTTHETVLMPQNRVRMLSKQKENLCFPCLIKREDNDVWVYTDETVVHAPLGIIGRPEVLDPFLNEDGRIALESLVSSAPLRMGKPLARRYPDLLQPLVDNVSKTRHFAELTGENATVRVLEQIDMGRLDYTLEYPSILQYYNMTQGASTLVYYETAELANNGVAGAIGCTNNAWGQDVVKRINQALPNVLNTPIYQKQQEFWRGSLPKPQGNIVARKQP
ncbi:hypothetical protein [Alteromonas gracilis]|uniref:hypothetical protein n=1 Tax=Alteromonas gracilis TaxID=1479524 RepID=UPI0030CCCFD2